MAGDVGILRRKDDNSFRDIKDIVNILMSRGCTSESLYDYGNYYINIIKREHSHCFTVEDSSGKKIDYYRYVYIEGSGDRGFMYLNFLHEYFKLFPEDIFKGEADYLYTKEDIDRMYEKEIWLGNWYDLDPKTL